MNGNIKRSSVINSDDYGGPFAILSIGFILIQLLALVYVFTNTPSSPFESDANDVQSVFWFTATSQLSSKSSKRINHNNNVKMNRNNNNNVMNNNFNMVQVIDHTAYLMNKLEMMSKMIKEEHKKKSGIEDIKLTNINTESMSLYLNSLFQKPCNNPKSNLKVMTYNIWNHNEPWDLRRSRIALMILNLKPHIIGFQEVTKNQVQDIQTLLSKYHLQYFETTSNEGLLIASQYEIEGYKQFTLESSKGTESVRTLASVIINEPNLDKVNILLTHLPLGDQEQCKSALEILDIVNDPEKMDIKLPQIVIGDMNTYFDFEWPMDLLTLNSGSFLSHSLNPCSRYWSSLKLPSYHWPFKDSWNVLRPNEFGKTFPSFNIDKNNQIDSTRADRILVRQLSPETTNKHLIECEINTVGDEHFSYAFNEKIMLPSDHFAVIASYFVDTRPRDYKDKMIQAANRSPQHDALYALKKPPNIEVPSNSVSLSSSTNTKQVQFQPQQVQQQPAQQVQQQLQVQQPQQQVQQQQQQQVQQQQQQVQQQQQAQQQDESKMKPEIQVGVVQVVDVPTLTPPPELMLSTKIIQQLQKQLTQLTFDQKKELIELSEDSLNQLGEEKKKQVKYLQYMLNQEMLTDAQRRKDDNLREITPPKVRTRKPNVKAKDNAVVTTSMYEYQMADDGLYHGPENVYDGNKNTYYWSNRVVMTGDWIEVKLSTPIRAKKVVAYTGNTGGLGGGISDYLHDGVLEVEFGWQEDNGVLKRSQFVPVAIFHNGQAEAELSDIYPNAKAKIQRVRLRCTKDQEQWLMVSEIEIS